MQRDIPEDRALVRYINGERARVIYRDHAGAVVSKIVMVPSHLRSALAGLSSASIRRDRYRTEIEVPVLRPAHGYAGGPILGQVHASLRGDGQSDRVSIERMRI